MLEIFLKRFIFITLTVLVSCSGAMVGKGILLHLPKVRQATNYTCGVAALQSVLRYYGTQTREDLLAAELGATREIGTNHRSIVAYAIANGYSVEAKTDMSLEDLKARLREGKPAICAFQAWPDTPPANWEDVWDSGHYAVAIGYDSRRIIFMDPSTLGNYTYIPSDEFLNRWHDIDSDDVTRLEHFCMVISKPKPAYDQDEILRLE